MEKLKSQIELGREKRKEVKRDEACIRFMVALHILLFSYPFLTGPGTLLSGPFHVYIL